MKEDLISAIQVLDFHIDEMTELLVRDFYLCHSLLKQQSFILQSLKVVRDTLLKEPKKDKKC